MSKHALAPLSFVGTGNSSRNFSSTAYLICDPRRQTTWSNNVLTLKRRRLSTGTRYSCSVFQYYNQTVWIQKQLMTCVPSKAVLKNFVKYVIKNLCRSFCFIESQAWNLLEKRLQYRYFLVNCLWIFRVPTKHRKLLENFQEKSHWGIWSLIVELLN